MKFNNFNTNDLKDLFEELEFKTILSRVLSLSNSEEDEKAATEVVREENKNTEAQLDMFALNETTSEKKEEIIKDYQITSSIKEVYSEIEKSKICSFQILCNTFNNNEQIIGLSLSYKKDKSVYIPLKEVDFELINSLFRNKDILKIGYNIKEQLKILLKYNITDIENIFDVSIAHYLLQPDMRHDIEMLSENYLKYSTTDISSLLGKGKQKRNLSDLSEEKQSFYCSELADVQIQLTELFLEELKELKLLDLFNDIEMPLLKVLSKIEVEGINLDVIMLQEFSKELTEEIKLIENKIFEYSEEEFNIASPKQMGEILFDKMQIVEKVKKTKSGQYSTSEETLSKLKGVHPIIDLILEFRGLQKLLTTYVNALPQLIDDTSGRIHTTFNQSVAATGRLSSVNPNLQNIPIRTEKGRKMREAFVPRNSDFELLAADYSQIELRIIAGLSKDESMINAFTNGRDIHTETASKIFSVVLEDVTREMRNKAKMVNFGIIYGISAFGLSQRLNVKRSEAKEIN